MAERCIQHQDYYLLPNGIECFDVIRYFIDQNGKSKYPTISKVCNFSGEVLPEVGAIIWGPDPTHKFMMPYKVARIDFMEDEADGISTQHRILIVVRPASND